MGENTKIEWATHTFNPWIGCTKIQPECTNCYAEVETFPRVSRGRGLELWGPKSARHVTSDENWKLPERWNRQAGLRAIGSRERPRVFCASMADVFEEREDLVAPRMRLLNLIEATPNLDWLLLTKRPENINKLTARWDGIMPNNVWVGTTGGTQKTLDKNLSELMRVNARIRFVSVEPLIAPVRLDPFDIGKRDTGGRLVDWVIVGGESGSAARPCALEWLEAIVEECHSAQIPCLVKQLGSLVVSEHRTASAATLRTIFGREPKSAIAPNGEHWAWRMGTTHPKGGDPSEWPEELRVRQFPEAASP